MTDEQLEQLRSLVKAGDKATQGPWQTDLENHDSPYQHIMIEAEYGMKLGEIWQDDACFEMNPQQIASAKFITQAANARPALKAALDRIEELKGALERLLQQVNDHAATNEVMPIDTVYVRESLKALKGKDDGK